MLSSREPHCIGRRHLNCSTPQAADHEYLGVFLDRCFPIRGGREESFRPLPDLNQHLAEVPRGDIRRYAPHLAYDVVRHASLSELRLVMPAHGNASPARGRGWRAISTPG